MPLLIWGALGLATVVSIGWASREVGEATGDITRSVVIATVAGVAATYIIKKVL